MHLSDILVIVRGGGAVGTGVAYRLFRAGFTIMVTELAQPRCIRRGASFAEAVYTGTATVEGVTARLAEDPMDGMAFSVLEEIPVVSDEAGEVVTRMQPRIVVDARMAGRNLGTRRRDAPLVIGLGDGFTAGKDCHAVVDASGGNCLGRVYWEGAVEPVPDAGSRVVRATGSGLFSANFRIGEVVKAGDRLGEIDGVAIFAAISGVVDGLIHHQVMVAPGEIVAEVDPDGDPEQCFLISNRDRAVGGGVLEAIMTGINQWRLEPPPERDLL